MNKYKATKIVLLILYLILGKKPVDYSKSRVILDESGYERELKGYKNEIKRK